MALIQNVWKVTYKDWVATINPKIDFSKLWFNDVITKDGNWKIHKVTEKILVVKDWEVYIYYDISNDTFSIRLDATEIYWDIVYKNIYPNSTEELQTLINIFKI